MLKVYRLDLSTGSSLYPKKLTVVIGPNNGGKSQFLRDIKSSITSPGAVTPSLSSIDVEALPNWHSVIDKLSSGLKIDDSGRLMFDRLDPELTQAQPTRHPQSFVQQFMVAESRHSEGIQQRNALAMFGGFFIANLGTETRLQLIARQTSARPDISGPGSVSAAMQSAPPAVVGWINRQVRAAFDSDLIVDDSVSFQIGLALGREDEISTHYQERKIAMASLRKVEEQGDGIRAFCGVVSAAATTDRSILLIDEPEAFLHPPQALLMGRAIARLEAIDAQVFVATHSAEVLRGIIAETRDVEILRLSQTTSGFHSKLIPAEDLDAISSDPLLSSARVLDGLFYRGVVIAESDSDAAIYRRVLEDLDQSGSVHFLNAYGKSATIKMIAPYRTMGLGHAVIVDFDILRDASELKRLVGALAGNWADFEDDYNALTAEIETADRPEDRVARAHVALQEALENLGSGGPERERLEALRRDIRAVREQSSTWLQLKKRGRSALSVEGKEAFDRLEANCMDVGLFIVPCGEREAWLPGIVEYSQNKSAWTENALTALADGKVSDDHPIRIFIERVQKFVLK